MGANFGISNMWVHEILVWVKILAWMAWVPWFQKVGMSQKQDSLRSGSFHDIVSVPYLGFFLKFAPFLMFISYSNWPGPKLHVDINSA